MLLSDLIVILVLGDWGYFNQFCELLFEITFKFLFASDSQNFDVAIEKSSFSELCLTLVGDFDLNLN